MFTRHSSDWNNVIHVSIREQGNFLSIKDRCPSIMEHAFEMLIYSIEMTGSCIWLIGKISEYTDEPKSAKVEFGTWGTVRKHFEITKVSFLRSTIPTRKSKIPFKTSSKFQHFCRDWPHPSGCVAQRNISRSAPRVCSVWAPVICRQKVLM